jgi:DNA gyrase subunit A
MHQVKVHQVPEGSRTGKGIHMANLAPLEQDEYITTVLAVREFSEERCFLFVTRRGMVKRSRAALYARCRKSGLLAVGLRADDELIMVREVRDASSILLATAGGMGIRFSCRDVRDMGRGAAGVKGIALRSGDTVAAAVILEPAQVGEGESAGEPVEIMSISSLGFGKRTSVDLYRLQSRGGRGTINFRVSPKTGPVIGALPVRDKDGLVLLTSTNKIIRMGVDEVRSVGRPTMGVRLVRLDEGASVVGFDTVSAEDGEPAREGAPQPQP